MKRLLIMYFLFNCILNIQSAISQDENFPFSVPKKQKILSSITMTIYYKNSFTHRTIFTIFDDSELGDLKNNLMIFHTYSDVNHNDYKQYLYEIKRIKCIRDTNEVEGLFIIIRIEEKGNLVEKITFKGLTQIKVLLIQLKKIFGKERFLYLDFIK